MLTVRLTHTVIRQEIDHEHRQLFPFRLRGHYFIWPISLVNSCRLPCRMNLADMSSRETDSSLRASYVSVVMKSVDKQYGSTSTIASSPVCVGLICELVIIQDVWQTETKISRFTSSKNDRSRAKCSTLDKEDDTQKPLLRKDRKSDTRVETSRRTCLVRFAQKQGVSELSARNDDPFVFSCKTTLGQKFKSWIKKKKRQ